MPQRPIMVADDIGAQGTLAKQRSRLICSLAANFAERFGTRVDLLYVEDMKSYPSNLRVDASTVANWHAEHEKRMAIYKELFPSKSRLILKTGSPSQEILKRIRSKDRPELIVMGTQGKKGLDRLIIGSVAEEVIRHSKRPVVVIGPSVHEEANVELDRKDLKILVATDLGKTSRAAELYGLTLGKRLKAKVVLFHTTWDNFRAIQADIISSGLIAADLDELFSELRDDSLKALKQKVAIFQKQGVECNFKLLEDASTSSTAVPEEAKQGYSLVVMGTHGRSSLMNTFFGSTARETVLNSPAPVVTVHPGV